MVPLAVPTPVAGGAAARDTAPLCHLTPEEFPRENLHSTEAGILDIAAENNRRLNP